jgi:hypothetical protein
MTYDQLLNRIIVDGIAEVNETYNDPKDQHKRDGAVEGFEACRDKTPEQIVMLWREAERAAASARSIDEATEDSLKTYWRCRYKALQIEWCLNVLSVGLGTPLLSHLPTARAAMKYASIVGVAGQGASL